MPEIFSLTVKVLESLAVVGFIAGVGGVFGFLIGVAVTLKTINRYIDMEEG